MQSIYRFRGAEVSLFLHTQENGLGAISLTPLTLQVNFRSNEKVIDWINQTFVDIFPRTTNKTFGGVTYSRAFAAKGADQTSNVKIIPVQKGVEDTAQKAVDEIIKAHKDNPTGSIAVLGRTRKHLSPIIAILKKLNIPFVAHEVDYLAMRMHVIDCVSLLRATTDLTDKISWYAILRAPWLGLSLSDIYAISQHNSTGIVWNALLNFDDCKGLSTDAILKLKSWVPRIQYWLAHRQRKPLHEWLRGLWLLIGGAHCYGESVQKDIDAVFKLIGDCETGGIIHDFAVFEERLAQLYADVENVPTNNSEIMLPVELLTLHKAKGLEFDTVIMPYLHARPNRNDPALLLWFEYALTSQVHLLLAPYRFVAQTFDPLYRYVDHCLSQKDRFEIARLLYVGVTRAKNQLVLLGEYEYNDKGELKTPPKGSFWEMLMPKVDPDPFKHQQNMGTIDSALQKEKYLLCLEGPYELPNDISCELTISEDLNRPEIGDFVARCAGTVFHRMLQRLTSQEDINHSLDGISSACQLALKRMGLTAQEQNEALTQVLKAIENLLADEKGRWIIDPQHLDRQSEWALSYKAHHGIENMIIDYSFIDKDGVRWIIDYKLTHHHVLTEVELAEEKAKYRKQLDKYRKIVSCLEHRPVRCALYFPLAKVFSEIENGVIND